MPGSSRYLEAFKESYNAIGLASLVAVSAALLTPVPLLAGLVAETIYLLFVPDSKWYTDRLATKYDNEVVARREKLKQEVGPTLPPTVMARFSRLESMRNQIGGQTFEGKKWFREVLRKLDYLMEKFLLFGSKQVQFQTYLRSVLDETTPAGVVPPPAVQPSVRRVIRGTDASGEIDETWVQSTVATIQGRYSKEIDDLDEMMKKDENLHNQAVLEKRADILTRRRQYVSQIGEILINLNHQLHLMEDTFGLINDEIRARSPEQVLADIEDVVFQTDSLTEALQAVSPFDQMPVAAGAAKLYNEPNAQ
ncbi:MAG: hypothetical protein P4L46_17395 [Fimbriimonas sp.]|nr:hypothetical protein [Fimbriimonas sp.]